MKRLVLLLLLTPASLFAQPDEEIIYIDDNSPVDVIKVDATIHQNYKIENGNLILNYSRIDAGDPKIGCSGGSTNYSILLPYTSDVREVALANQDFTFKYSYSGGMTSNNSSQVDRINLSFMQVGELIRIDGLVEYAVDNEFNEYDHKTLTIHLEMDAHTSLVHKHYTYDSNPLLNHNVGEPEEPVVFAEIEPEFPGGPEGLMKYINDNIVYPQSCIEAGIEGRVYYSFVIEKDGSISTIKLLRGIHRDIDKEAFRVLKSMPKWKPGEMGNGRKVRVRFNVPVSFRLK